MLNLAFPKYEFRLKEVNQKKFIFDEIRKKYISSKQNLLFGILKPMDLSS